MAEFKYYSDWYVFQSFIVKKISENVKIYCFKLIRRCSLLILCRHKGHREQNQQSPFT